MTDTVGRWAFSYDEDMRAYWEARLRSDPALTADEVARQLQAIEAEAALASVEITAEGALTSLVGDAPVYRAELRVESGEVCFDKPTGVRVTLRLSDRGELVADEPGKPQMRFRRSESRNAS